MQRRWPRRLTSDTGAVKGNVMYLDALIRSYQENLSREPSTIGRFDLEPMGWAAAHDARRAKQRQEIERLRAIQAQLKESAA